MKRKQSRGSPHGAAQPPRPGYHSFVAAGTPTLRQAQRGEQNVLAASLNTTQSTRPGNAQARWCTAYLVAIRPRACPRPKVFPAGTRISSSRPEMMASTSTPASIRPRPVRQALSLAMPCPAARHQRSCRLFSVSSDTSQQASTLHAPRGRQPVQWRESARPAPLASARVIERHAIQPFGHCTAVPLRLDLARVVRTRRRAPARLFRPRGWQRDRAPPLRFAHAARERR